MTCVGEFLKFGVTQGWVSAWTVSMLSNPKFVRYLPPGYDCGEAGQFRPVTSAVFRFRQPRPGYESFSDEQIDRILELSVRARDRFLVLLLSVTGMFSAGRTPWRTRELRVCAAQKLMIRTLPVRQVWCK